MHKLGFHQEAQDAAQQYILNVLEGKIKNQKVFHFCIDFIRKVRGRTDVPRKLKEKYFIEAMASVKFQDESGIYNRVDYNKIMNKIYEMKNEKQRDILLKAFAKGLSVADIARAGKATIQSTDELFKRSIRSIKERMKIQ